MKIHTCWKGCHQGAAALTVVHWKIQWCSIPQDHVTTNHQAEVLFPCSEVRSRPHKTNKKRDDFKRKPPKTVTPLPGIFHQDSSWHAWVCQKRKEDCTDARAPNRVQGYSWQRNAFDDKRLFTNTWRLKAAGFNLSAWNGSDWESAPRCQAKYLAIPRCPRPLTPFPKTTAPVPMNTSAWYRSTSATNFSFSISH